VLPGFISRGPVVNEDDIAAFEGRCGFQLPPDYRRFLLDQNGGDRPVASAPEEEDEGGTETVQFFSLGAAAAAKLPVEKVAASPERWPKKWRILTSDLDMRMTWCRGDGGPRYYPPELLPVAELTLGVLLLRLKGRGTGAVLHCKGPDGYEPGHTKKVAGSFAELIRGLDDVSWD
jgi:hypothetical protein